VAGGPVSASRPVATSTGSLGRRRCVPGRPGARARPALSARNGEFAPSRMGHPLTQGTAELHELWMGRRAEKRAIGSWGPAAGGDGRRRRAGRTRWSHFVKRLHARSRRQHRIDRRKPPGHLHAALQQPDTARRGRPPCNFAFTVRAAWKAPIEVEVRLQLPASSTRTYVKYFQGDPGAEGCRLPVVTPTRPNRPSPFPVKGVGERGGTIRLPGWIPWQTLERLRHWPPPQGRTRRASPGPKQRFAEGREAGARWMGALKPGPGYKLRERAGLDDAGRPPLERAGSGRKVAGLSLVRDLVSVAGWSTSKNGAARRGAFAIFEDVVATPLCRSGRKRQFDFGKGTTIALDEAGPDADGSAPRQETWSAAQGRAAERLLLQSGLVVRKRPSFWDLGGPVGRTTNHWP